jgi:hypothetical protein
MSQWDYGRPAPDHHDPHAGEYTDGFDDDGTSPYPITWERESVGTALQRLGLPDEDWPPRRRRGRRGGHRGGYRGGFRNGRTRWLVLAVVVIAGAGVGAGLVLTGGNPAGQASTRPSPAPLQVVPPVVQTPQSAPAGQAPLTMAQARQVLAAYTAANNAANARRSDTALGAIETGSSYAVDAGIYRVQQAQHAAPFPAFAPQRAQYYIPRETAYPRWFAVQVTNAALDAPKRVFGTEYLLFTQATPGAGWKNAVEPYMVPGATAPPVALGADGLATPVAAATPLAVPQGQIAQVTASSLDGAGPLPNPGNLADLMDRGFWQRKLPSSSVTDSHTPSAGGVYGLRTAGGGALLFYTDAAELTLTAPAGEAMHLTVPGYYSPGQALTRAGIGYLEQFATYDPPPGGSGLRVVADYSGITSAS